MDDIKHNFKFAHIADCHLGRWNKEPHKTNEMKAFQISIELCMFNNVDFVIISGDIFNSPVPNLDVADEVFKILKRAINEGLRFYVVFGSHDNSRNRQSIAKLLVTSGMVKSVSSELMEKGNPYFTVDEKTGVKIIGIDGLTGGVEKNIYDNLDKKPLEDMDGFKIFMFHSAITEYLPENLWMIEGIDIEQFPKNFNYYAGGHIHRRAEIEDPNLGLIVYPGPLYGADYRDFKKTAEGEEKGFYINEFKDGVLETKFNPIYLDEFVNYEILLVDMTAQQIRKRLEEFKPDVKDKIVMIKLKGSLKGGSEGELHINEFNHRLIKEGAKEVITNTRGLTVEVNEIDIEKLKGMEKDEIIEYVLKEEQKRFDKEHLGLINEELQGDDGVQMSLMLLDIMKQNRKHKEKKEDYENRIISEAKEIF